MTNGADEAYCASLTPEAEIVESKSTRQREVDEIPLAAAGDIELVDAGDPARRRSVSVLRVQPWLNRNGWGYGGHTAGWVRGDNCSSRASNAVGFLTRLRPNRGEP
ncbi:MAG: hypothetical protein OXU77_04665 [Gammaproteobacteria bacterium]|nr:hypothetical protein [Gammaproteobacteria bacterium]MDE0443077.1 hypothetical protein [Gammaproteobacteria bacterium]